MQIHEQMIQDIAAKIKTLVASSPIHELEHNLHALIRGALTKMELVTREEYDVQTEILRQTREKLDALQQRVDALEK